MDESAVSLCMICFLGLYSCFVSELINAPVNNNKDQRHQRLRFARLPEVEWKTKSEKLSQNIHLKYHNELMASGIYLSMQERFEKAVETTCYHVVEKFFLLNFKINEKNGVRNRKELETENPWALKVA